MITLIDSLSYTNKLRTVSPMWKIGFAAVLFLMSYMSHPVIQLFISLWLLIWTVSYAQIPALYYLRLIGAPCLFYAASLPALLIEFQRSSELSTLAYSSTLLFTVFHWTAFLTDNGMLTAITLLTRIIACLSCMTFIMLTTPISELFQVMKRLRVPALVLEMMLIMYRFLFLLESIALDMYTAQKSRGGQTGFKNRLNDTAILIVRLFAKSMQRYKGVSYGLITRGFIDEIHMAPYQGKPIPSRYLWESCTGILILVLLELLLRWREI
ncbi:cobalt ECF transporter T component CbiQ [Paenibacillus sp. LMG 31456]|uniref:Cobalt ECF transporter T component CbiQ n=1 Tax=Paenibacillus foliorum TaxID=2654974 RepID=A0A972GRN5_9BACL|nr:cobalt ECF transporter T component CbiQ [Paenibacillus foliorum]NOU95569.1 cobalt ECF transporter T component CbiQ [Paenibacillus foliorum]